MTPFVYRSTLALLLISLFLCLAIWWKHDHLAKPSTPRIESRYQTLPKAPSMTMQHDSSTPQETQMQEMQMNQKLDSKVTFGTNALTITNGDTKDWTDCTLEMNQTVVRSGYIYHQDVFQSQKTVTIPYSSFVRDGQSFDISVSHPNNVMLMCANQGNMTGWNFFSNR